MSDSSTPAPSEVPSPLLVASLERLRQLPTERVPLWAAYWIAGGHDGEALRYLAGLHGDDPVEVHDALPEALMDCGVEMPDSDVAAATVAFTYAARLHLNGLAGPRWVARQIVQIVDGSRDSKSLADLPLGRLYRADCEWADWELGDRWGRSPAELTAAIRKACEEQLRSASAA